MIPHAPTPDWAKSRIDLIVPRDDPKALDALLELLAAIAPTQDEEKYKHEIAWAAIAHGYKKTQDCYEACQRYLGVAV
jgi:hypothetical protein